MDEGNFGPSYRRGLVLGLTLAEVFLLLLFLLIAVFAYLLSIEERKMEYINQAFDEQKLPYSSEPELKQSTDKFKYAYRDLETVTNLVDDPDEFIETVKSLKDLKEILGELGIEMNDPNALKTRLRQMRDEELLAEKFKDVCGDLKSLEDKLKSLHGENKTAEEVLETCPPTIKDDEVDAAQIDLPETLEEALPVIERQKYQISALTKKLKDVLGGKGLVYPPCWVRAGKTVYSYSVSITDDGLKVSAGDNREGMDFSPLKRNGSEPSFTQVITGTEFNLRTKGLFNWSVENDCRFFVRVSDDTSATNKKGYKSSLADVENHFYKLLLD